MSVDDKPVFPDLQLTEAQFNALDRREQLAYLIRVLLEFDRRYKKWLAQERGINAAVDPMRPSG